MRFLVFQQIACEHPAIFRDFLEADGIAWDAVELDEGEAVPEFGGYDALLVMGGPMDTWQEAEHPWLVAEKRAIRRWVEAGSPISASASGTSCWRPRWAARWALAGRRWACWTSS